MSQPPATCGCLNINLKFTAISYCLKFSPSFALATSQTSGGHRQRVAKHTAQICTSGDAQRPSPPGLLFPIPRQASCLFPGSPCLPDERDLPQNACGHRSCSLPPSAPSMRGLVISWLKPGARQHAVVSEPSPLKIILSLPECFNGNDIHTGREQAREPRAGFLKMNHVARSSQAPGLHTTEAAFCPRRARKAALDGLVFWNIHQRDPGRTLKA